MNCAYCGKEFKMSAYQKRQANVGNPIYCSKSCGTAARYNKTQDVDENLLIQIKDKINNSNLSLDEIRILFNFSQPKFKEICNKYNLKRNQKQINNLKINNMRITIKKKYGVENAMEVEEFRKKISSSLFNLSTSAKQRIIERTKQTKLEKYGDENYNNNKQAKETNLRKYGYSSPLFQPSIIEKRKEKSLQIFGVENPLSLKAVRDLSKITMKERYGVEYSLQSQQIRDKANKTIKERYGVSNIMHSNKYKGKLVSTMLERYNVSSGFLTENAINSHKCGTKSKINNQFVNFLKERTKQIIIQEKSLIKFIYDIQIGENILIDINPTVSHNTYISYPYKLGVLKENKTVSKNYHLERKKLAEKNNFTHISVFDWDDWEKVSYLVQDKQVLYARHLKCEPISKELCDEFLNKYHLQNTCRGQDIRIGLFTQEGMLVQVMTFGKPRYNKNYQWELLRLCSHKDYRIVGGARRLFTHFLIDYKPESIISYCDNSKFSGNVYKELEFKQEGIPIPSKHWSKGCNHITDNLLRQRGYDQLFKTKYGKGTSNETLMIQNGWLPIYDCGQTTYIWKQNGGN